MRTTNSALVLLAALLLPATGCQETDHMMAPVVETPATPVLALTPAHVELLVIGLEDAMTRLLPAHETGAQTALAQLRASLVSGDVGALDMALSVSRSALAGLDVTGPDLNAALLALDMVSQAVCAAGGLPNAQGCM